MRDLNVDGVTQAVHRGLLKCLSETGVGVDRTRDILQARAHFQRQGESRGKLGNPVSHRLDAQNEMIVGAGDDPDEAVVPLQRHRLAISAERKTADCGLDAGRLCVLGRHPDRHKLGISEADRRNGVSVPDALFAGDDFRHHFSLRHSAVSKHRLSRHIPDRENAPHRGPGRIRRCG